MKKILLVACGLLIVFAACKKDPDPVSRVVDVTAPSIVVNGDKVVSVKVGGTFTDPGATLTDDVTGAVTTIYADEPIDLDLTKAGMYTLTYSAKNANGYATTAARYIGVTNYNDGANLSGPYVRTSNNRKVNVTKEAASVYAIHDFGGAGIPADIGYFVVLDTNHIDFGNQYSETVGYFTAKIDHFYMRTGDTSFAYALDAAGYGTAVRNFVKQ